MCDGHHVEGTASRFGRWVAGKVVAVAAVFAAAVAAAAARWRTKVAGQFAADRDV